ncbi:MAG: hypothetical protein CL613_07080 [Aquimarina sp.]|nr:hypothetical protein [Aquimarina sp.]
MEIFTGAVASIAALFTAMIGLLKLPVFSFMEHTRHKKMTQLLNTKEVISLFDNYETNFKDSFIKGDLTEDYFYMRTGIRTNEKNIPKYVALKNKLGRDYTWEIIKKAKIHLDTDQDDISVTINRLAKIYYIVAMILVIFFFVVPLIAMITSAIEIEDKSLVSILKFLFTISFPLIFSFLVLKSTESTSSARIIEKRLSRSKENIL